MATLRNWLDYAGFDWEHGRIIFQAVGKGCTPGWSAPIDAMVIDKDHPILNRRFSDGYGGPMCPRIIAKDEKFTYFPYQYDGSTSLEVIHNDIDQYLNIENQTPYPGG